MKVIPLPLREIKAEMVIKGISLSELAGKADVNYSNASAILNGRRHDVGSLERLKKALSVFKCPKSRRAA